MYSAFLRCDVPGILVHLDDDIIWIVAGSWAVPMAAIRKGLTEVRQFLETVEKMLEIRLFENDDREKLRHSFLADSRLQPWDARLSGLVIRPLLPAGSFRQPFQNARNIPFSESLVDRLHSIQIVAHS